MTRYRVDINFTRSAYVFIYAKSKKEAGRKAVDGEFEDMHGEEDDCDYQITRIEVDNE